MNKLIAFLEIATAFELSVVLAIAVTVGLMLAVIVWEIMYALDRATKLIIKILYIPISWMAYKGAQVLILTFVAAALYVMMK